MFELGDRVVLDYERLRPDGDKSKPMNPDYGTVIFIRENGAVEVDFDRWRAPSVVIEDPAVLSAA